jgi:hypothetical protein
MTHIKHYSSSSLHTARCLYSKPENTTLQLNDYCSSFQLLCAASPFFCRLLFWTCNYVTVQGTMHNLLISYIINWMVVCPNNNSVLRDSHYILNLALGTMQNWRTQHHHDGDWYQCCVALFVKWEWQESQINLFSSMKEDTQGKYTLSLCWLFSFRETDMKWKQDTVNTTKFIILISRT